MSFSVESFINEMQQIEWFHNVGQVTESGPKYVDFHFVASLEMEMYKAWGECLIAHETPIDRLIIEHSLIGEQNEIQDSIDIIQLWQDKEASFDFLYELDETYSDPETGFYKDSGNYPSEFIWYPNKLIRYAAYEMLVSSYMPELRFFQDLLKWFEKGHWPIGWEGEWPSGRIIVW